MHGNADLAADKMPDTPGRGKRAGGGPAEGLADLRSPSYASKQGPTHRAALP